MKHPSSLQTLVNYEHHCFITLGPGCAAVKREREKKYEKDTGFYPRQTFKIMTRAQSYTTFCVRNFIMS